MTFLKNLLNVGIAISDAQILEAHYANEPEFIDGLETIARALAGVQPLSMLPPAGEPWRSFHQRMSGRTDVDVAFYEYIDTLPGTLQIHIAGAVTTRQGQIEQFSKAQQIPQGKKRKTADYVKVLNNLGYKFRYNLCTHDIEVNGAVMTDLIQAEIRAKVRDLGIGEVNIVEDVCVYEAGRNRYDPIREYFTSLKFQGGDPISELAAHVTDEHGVFGMFLRRWLIGACARVMAHEQNRMLVMDGRQQMGKDSLIRWLASPLPEYYSESPIIPDDKDHRLRLMSTWIWNATELGATTRRADREALKAFLTTQTVRERKAFGHFDIRGQAITTFAGTLNDEGGFLNDPTGHRRYAVAHLLDIDWGYVKLDVDQIWAQAYDLYLTGEPWHLTGDELRRANEINDSYQVADLVEETIKEIFTIDPADMSSWMSTWEIMDTLKSDNSSYSMARGGGLRAGSEIDTRRLASAMTRLKLKKSNVYDDATGRRRRGYFGIKKR